MHPFPVGGVKKTQLTLHPYWKLWELFRLRYLQLGKKFLGNLGMDQEAANQSTNTYNHSNYSSVGDQLKDMINKYLEKFPNLTVSALAKRCNVSATTFRRILQSEKPFAPAPHIVLNIVSYIHREQNLAVLIKKMEGPIEELLTQCFGKFSTVYEETPHVYDIDLNEILSDKTNYLIYKLAANDAGTHATIIQQIFGDIGTKKLEKLLEIGAVYQDNDHKIHAKEKNFSLNLELAAEHLQELVKFYKPEELALGKNIYYTVSESLNQEGIDEVKKIQKEAVKKIYSIMQDKKYHGIYPYFSINLADTLLVKQMSGVLQ
jgi:AraC-like DNA-binding protein